MSPTVLWTIAHSNHEFDAFARLLGQEAIEFVVDVRSYPYSRHAPQFNREQLREALRGRRIRYLFLGEELGGRPASDEHYDAEGHALYAEMASEPRFVAALDRLLDGAQEHRIALACSEADPHDCHRRLLVGKVLADRGAELRHILRDGSVLVERSVEIESGESPTLFGETRSAWRSTRSVSHRQRLSTSSAG
jgi:uncharacterized protein (DUF488 family)